MKGREKPETAIKPTHTHALKQINNFTQTYRAHTGQHMCTSSLSASQFPQTRIMHKLQGLTDRKKGKPTNRHTYDRYTHILKDGERDPKTHRHGNIETDRQAGRHVQK